jgi:hypothetical protein
MSYVHLASSVSPDKSFVGLMRTYQNIYTHKFKMGEYFFSNNKNHSSTI